MSEVQGLYLPAHTSALIFGLFLVFSGLSLFIALRRIHYHLRAAFRIEDGDMESGGGFQSIRGRVKAEDDAPVMRVEAHYVGAGHPRDLLRARNWLGFQRKVWFRPFEIVLPGGDAARVEPDEGSLLLVPPHGIPWHHLGEGTRTWALFELRRDHEVCVFGKLDQEKVLGGKGEGYRNLGFQNRLVVRPPSEQRLVIAQPSLLASLHRSLALRFAIALIAWVICFIALEAWEFSILKYANLALFGERCTGEVIDMRREERVVHSRYGSRTIILHWVAVVPRSCPSTTPLENPLWEQVDEPTYLRAASASKVPIMVDRRNGQPMALTSHPALPDKRDPIATTVVLVMMLAPSFFVFWQSHRTRPSAIPFEV
ncbi:MAG: hypothetical protein NZM37_05465 [Sandaracinaceae bacterium]|nr:hypothetical protein [Sandaracinaceae bacterium]MDW8246539.1 hypothetical protein [Sandaracinaceae bacterium]